MTQKKILSELLNDYDLLVIENHIIYSYIEFKNLNYKESPILKEIFDFVLIDQDILFKVSKLNINSIKMLENCLELMIPKSDRKINGAFFTPQYIIDYIINDINPQIDEKNLDPSCGCGAFLIGLLQFYKSKYNKSIRSILRDNIFGADILEYNIYRSKIIITLFALENNEVIHNDDFNLFHRDSLNGKWDIKFNNIVGNPPYVKFQDLSDDIRINLLSNWQSIKKGNFNLYFAFFELGYSLLKTYGKLAYITPNNYFTSIAGEPLREFLKQKQCLEKIVNFNSTKIFEAQTYTAITFLSKTKNNVFLYDHINGNSPQQFLNNFEGSQINIQDLNSKKWRLLKSSDLKNIHKIENIGMPIGKLFNINVGIATLRDEVYFVDSNYYKNGLYLKITQNGSFKIEEDCTKPVYKISDFKDDLDLFNNTRRIIFPYKYNEMNRLVPIPEDEFKQKYPNCYKYLISEKSTLLSRDSGKTNYNPFYIWGRTQGLNKFGIKILTPTFSQKPRFLLNEDENSFFTNGYGISFKSEYINDYYISSIENRDVVVKILNSIIMHYYIINTSVSIEGGFPCYQKNFIEHFSMPNFTIKEIETLRKLKDKSEIDNYLINKYQLNIPLPNLCS